MKTEGPNCRSFSGAQYSLQAPSTLDLDTELYIQPPERGQNEAERDMLYYWKRSTALTDECAHQKRQRLMLSCSVDDSAGTADGEGGGGGGGGPSTFSAGSHCGGAHSDMDNNESQFSRDSPHPRHLCSVFPFIPPPCLSNSAHCNKCWCYSCEELAPCSLWGTGLNNSDHCNATASSWYWAKHKIGASQPDADDGGLAAISERPSSMSGLSHGLYGPSIYPLTLTSTFESLGENKLLHGESTDNECYPSCSPSSSIILVANRPRTDPSADCQWFEFGTVRVPVRMRQPERTLEDLIENLDRFSLDIFSHILGEGKASQLEHVELVGDGRASFQHQALLAELIANEAQGQLQVIVNISPEAEDRNLGIAHIRVFLKKARGDELFFLKELLKEVFPEDSGLQSYLLQVDEMRKWAESCDDWTSVAGLLRDLESNGYGEAPQPSGLSVPLRPYQRQSLQFMLDAEHREGGLLSLNYHKLPSTPSGHSLMYSSTLGHLMETKESGTVRGGFLCEEMGLGKTIEILALILANPCTVEKCPPGSSKGTLVVCPVSIVGQWANEVKSKLAANLSIYMYHGSKRIRDPKKLAKYDIVITTYATLGSDFSKATQATRHGSGFAEQFCPLLTVNWWRVVLDESHTVKDPAPLHSRACAKLKAERRWCCTGTPINTSIYDLYGQFLFLKLEPLDNKGVFRRRIGRPYERQCKSDDQTVLLWTLNKMMIRHTKQQKFNGRELLRLPPKTEQDIPVFFTSEERSAYAAVYQKVISKFEQFRCWGPTVVSKNILQIMSLLLPLRRLCSGGFVSNFDLNMTKREQSPSGGCSDVGHSNSISLPAAEADGVDDVEGECGICFDLMECPTKTPCGHWFCSECIMSTIGLGAQGLCPICRSSATASELITFQSKLKGIMMTSLYDNASSSTGSLMEDEAANAKGVQMNSKLKTLLADLDKVREENPGAKVLIFSQFMQTIAWLKVEFKKQNITYRFISGDMPMKKRAQAIEAFQKDPPTTVFLLSIRTGAVGITLTAASHVYMLEPCLNPALEEQAVGRCWRMGQERPVVIKRLYVENSVEANILKLLRSRYAPANTSDSPDSDSSTRPARGGKNGVADVAGCIRTDKQNLRLNEFEILFS
ncbi:protein MpRAD5 [Marchantia polymorpha subsp. ruderalis]|uniref:Uncharacterized protein n=2 Tax=Marchantia polymorpha TaxID=3197 RepID=A0AAF6AUD5_MARPO|nr:hypothetical protein MARPO_0002s0276 [Marchantia polymorpha]BBN00056.1 hypothetical protein Mp_1g26000 [Marchantia polymorpha subsp. ruderalis]|eukprot:PTQ49827.1 hypothetical protein MARPO_0002s0276 [Marchantia polymorpha]